MKKWIYLFTLVLFAVGLTYGCGQKAAPTAGVEGYVFAADKTTPIAGAVISAVSASTYGANAFASPSSLSGTTTDTNGYFRLDAPAGLTSIDVVILKGAFRAVINNVPITEGSITAVGDSNKKIILDPSLAQPGIVVTLGKLAVIKGSWDHMEDVLAKLGYGSADASGNLVVGTEQFDLIEGGTPFGQLLASPEGLASYEVIFINCGNASESLLSDPTLVSNIRNYVSNGGSLFVTDLSYDFVEQVFPEYIDFYGSDTTPTTSPEGMDDAQVGTSGITVEAAVLDPTMKTWLQGRGALNADGTIHIAGFLSGWAVMNGVGPDTKKWIEGNVMFSGAGANSAVAQHAQASSVVSFGTGVKPLTVSFNYGANGGKVIYTSYHTEDDPSPTLRPQEWILAYLVFEL